MYAAIVDGSLGEAGELAGRHGQTNTVLRSAELGLLAGVGLAELPAVVQGIGQSLVHGLGQTLRSGDVYKRQDQLHRHDEGRAGR